MVLNLVNDLLDLAKIESLKFKLDEEYYDFKSSINQAFDTMKPLSDIKHIKTEAIYKVNLKTSEELSLSDIDSTR